MPSKTDPAKYQKREAAAMERFEGEQSQYYEERFLPIEERLVQSGKFDVSENIKSSLLDFEQAKETYQPAAAEQKNRYLEGFGLQTNPEQMSPRQQSMMRSQKIFDATMEAGIRQGIRSGVSSDTTARRQAVLSMGQGMVSDQLSNFRMNTALAANRDLMRQQQSQSQGAMVGAGLSFLSAASGFKSQTPQAPQIATQTAGVATNIAAGVGTGPQY